jgi:hypothetical protein
MNDMNLLFTPSSSPWAARLPIARTANIATSPKKLVIFVHQESKIMEPLPGSVFSVKIIQKVAWIVGSVNTHSVNHNRMNAETVVICVPDFFEVLTPVNLKVSLCIRI